MEDTKVCSGSSIMDVLDDNILTEILLHLPLKLKFRCKAVCKQWLHLISSPYFVECVLAREEDRVSSMPCYLLYNYNPIRIINPFVFPEKLGVLVASEHDPEFAIQRFKFDFLSNGELPRVNGAHNGLLLCSKFDNIRSCDVVNELYVCNPLTGEWVSVPEPEVYKWKLIGFIVSCNNGSTKFKVVRRLGGSNFEVFSSDVGQWKDTGVAFPDIGDVLYSVEHCVVHDGMLHWRAETDTSRRIIAYDPDKNKCRVFSLNVLLSVPFELGLLGTSSGRLCYVSFASIWEKVISVYVLENYETEEWRPLLITQIISVLDVYEIHDACGFSMPLAFHPFDEKIIYFYIHPWRRMVSVNFQTQKWSLSGGLYIEGPMFPFVLPPWPTSVPQPIREAASIPGDDDWKTTPVRGNDDDIPDYRWTTSVRRDDDDIFHDDFGLGLVSS